MKKTFYIAGILVVVLVLGFAFGGSYLQPSAPSGQIGQQPSWPSQPVSVGESVTVETTGQQAQPTATTHTVEITSSGFSPSSLTIKAGDTVTWTNKGTSMRRPASNFHPTHTIYPETGGCVGSKFDACANLANGESFSFIFTQMGTWGYHDHIGTGSGSITVT